MAGSESSRVSANPRGHDRSGASVPNTPSGPWYEAVGEWVEEVGIGQGEPRVGSRGCRRPYPAVAIAQRQQRHRSFGREALEGHAVVRLAGSELADQRHLAIVVAASRFARK